MSEARESPPLDLRGRLALNQAEAAAALGMSENTLRLWTPRLPHIRAGNRILYPVDALRAWLAEEARSQAQAEDATAQRLLGAFSDS